MIPYRIEFGKKAESDFLKLPKDIQIRISDKLKLALVDPFRYFFHLEGRSDYKLRIGKYRVLVDINQTERTIGITKIGHRYNVYRK